MLNNHFIQEKIILPLGDFVTGQTVAKSLKFLQRSKFWSRQEIDDFQNDRLRKLIKHAYENVPYYHDLFNSLGLKPQDIQSKADLHKIPILTKAIIKKEGIDRFTAKNINPKDIIKGASSGSTGEPLVYLRTKDAYSINIAANLRGWYDMGYRMGDKYIKLSQNPRKNPIKRLQDWITRNKYLATNPLTDENLKIILDKIEEYKPKVIRCYPDPFLFLARYKKQHPEYKHIPTALTTTGNTLHKETRQEIEDAFGCKIFDSYSCEGNACVFECPTHTCYHSAEEYGISEILNGNGELVINGVGRLYSTDLWNFAHPFLRYDTQDNVEIDATPCSCGRSHLKIIKILGRDNDVIISPQGRKFIVHNFTGFFSQDTFNQNISISQFQVICKKDKSILFKLVVNNLFSDEIKNNIISFWEKEFQTKVKIEIVTEIPLHHNNKRKFIINE